MIHPARILGIATATPVSSMTQTHAAGMAADCCTQTDRQRRALHRLYESTTVENRASALLEHTLKQSHEGESVAADDQPPTLYNAFPPLGCNSDADRSHKNLSDVTGQALPLHDDPIALADPPSAVDIPSTEQRMRLYEQHAPPLAERAARAALQEADVSPDQITHLHIVTCTGFASPGIDHHLISRLNLSPGVARLQIGFMGCNAAVNALRAAADTASANPNARVLTVCVELCSAHFQYEYTADNITANALFGDGAAAFVTASSPKHQHANRRAWQIRRVASMLIPESAHAMSWRIRNHGFAMTLHPSVPDLIAEHAPGFIESLLEPAGLTPTEVDWAIHPGGPRVVSAFGGAINLPSEALDPSRHILRTRGNMSSPTVLFILKHLADQRSHAVESSGRPTVVISFGPGLVAEAALLGYESVEPSS